MAQRLALAVIPGVGWRASDICTIAQEAEGAGFEAIFATEVNVDVLAVAQLMGTATSAINVGSWIANIYLRNSYVCAKGAALIADATGGRMILGLGVSHQPINKALGVDMATPIETLRAYVTETAGWLRGEGPATHLPQQPSSYPVPIYLGAMTSTTVELAGEIADGIMPFLWSAERVARSRVWAARGRTKSPSRGASSIMLGIPTFVGNDIPALMTAARANLSLYTTLPFFQHLMRVSGFVDEAAEAERGAAEAERGAANEALSDRFLEAVCLIGPATKCLERLAEYSDAGLDLPILVAPIGVDGARHVIKAFGR